MPAIFKPLLLVTEIVPTYERGKLTVWPVTAATHMAEAKICEKISLALNYQPKPLLFELVLTIPIAINTLFLTLCTPRFRGDP